MFAFLLQSVREEGWCISKSTPLQLMYHGSESQHWHHNYARLVLRGFSQGSIVFLYNVSKIPMESVSNQLETIRLATSRLYEHRRHKGHLQSERRKSQVDLFRLQKIEFNFNNAGAKNGLGVSLKACWSKQFSYDWLLTDWTLPDLKQNCFCIPLS